MENFATSLFTESYFPKVDLFLARVIATESVSDWSHMVLAPMVTYWVLVVSATDSL